MWLIPFSFLLFLLISFAEGGKGRKRRIVFHIQNDDGRLSCSGNDIAIINLF